MKRAQAYMGSGNGNVDGGWFEILCCIKHCETVEGEFKHLAHMFSKRCPEKYDEVVVGAKYKSIQETEKPLTIATLYELLKRDSKEVFKQMQSKREKQKENMLISALEDVKPTGRKWCFLDYQHFEHQMQMKGSVDLNEVLDYLNTTTRFIVNHGNASWYTLNHNGGWVEIDKGLSLFKKLDFTIKYYINEEQFETTFDKLTTQTKNQRCKRSFVFTPYYYQEDMHDDIDLNLFTGYRASLTENKLNFDKINWMNEHLKYMCSPEAYDYVVNWLSMLIQYPKAKMPCLVFISPEGAGKTSYFAEFIGEGIIGKYAQTITDPNMLFGQFNATIS